MEIQKFVRFTSFLILILVSNVLVNAQDIPNKDSDENLVPKTLLTRISINLKEAKLLDAIQEIADKGNFHLNYRESIIPDYQKVSINLKNVPAIEALAKVLQQTKITFTITKSGQVVLIESKLNEVPQKKFTISGYVRDVATGEALIGTNIYVKELSSGCISNRYGFYSLTIPFGYHTIKYSYIGFKPKEVKIYLNQNIIKNIELEETVISGETVTITAECEDKNIKSTEMGTIRLIPKKLSPIPVLFGEQDILKTIHLLPGVAQSREGDCGFYVRGGNSDQNLVLLDEAPVYNAFHLLGFFSVFNSDAIKDVKLIKGSAPPKYGGRLSSVLDIKMNEGNSKKFNGSGGIGLIFSRLTLQGPISQNKGSYIISGRRTYADLFLKLSSNEEIKNSRLYFYDLNLKTNYQVSSNDQLFLSGYFGRDVFRSPEGVDISWGNKTATLRWNHIFNDKLFLNSSVIFSNFKYVFNIAEEDEGDSDIDITSVIHDVTMKDDFQYFINPNNSLNFGFNYIYYSFLPGEAKVRGDDNFDMIIGKRNAHDFALYASHKLNASARLKFDYGIRYSLFSVFGQGDIVNLLDEDENIDFELRKKEKTNYGGLEPRFSANFQLTKFSAIKLGFARNFQNIHLLSNSTSGTPLEVWQPSSSKVKPARADQISLGYFRNFKDNNYEASIEVYYKDMKNLVDYKEGADVLISSFFESEVASGQGWSYGTEFFFKKITGKLTGWIAYTLSKSEKKFGEINSGKPFPARYDRTHDFSVVGIYQLNKRWTCSVNWMYFTGDAVTIPNGKYIIDGHTFDSYTERNSYRMPAVHRLDINVTYATRKHGTWNFSLYNAYGRKNAYKIIFRNNYSNPEKSEAVRLALFSFVPSISYHFKF